MASSEKVFDQHVQQVVSAIQPRIIMDVGVGAGKIGSLCRSVCPHAQIYGFEVFQPYLETYKANHQAFYNQIDCVDFRDWVRSNSDWQADLIVFADVLEHFFYSEVHDVIQFCLYRVKYLLAIWPTEYPQNIEQGNQEQAHRSNFMLNDLVRYPVQLYHRAQLNRFSELHLILLRGMVRSDA